MKRKGMIALLLSATMLLNTGVCAEAKSYSSRLSDISIESDGQLMDLEGLVIEGNGTNDGARLHLDSNGEVVSELAIAVANNTLYLQAMGKTSEFNKTYAIDPTTVVRRAVHSVLDAIGDAVDSPNFKVEIFASDDTEEETEAQTEAEPETEAQQAMPDISFEGDVASVFSDCFVEEESSEYPGRPFGIEEKGVTVPEGEYAVHSFTLDTDHVAQVLDMLRINGEPVPYADALRESGVGLYVNGYTLENDATSVATYTLLFNDGDHSYTFSVETMKNAAEEGKTYCDVTFAQDDSMNIIQFVSTEEESESVESAISGMDVENAVVLSDMSLTDALNEVSEGLNTFLSDSMSTVLLPLMEQAMAEMETETELAETEAAQAE